VFPDAKKLNQQFKYADRRGFRAVVIAGADEMESNQVQVKWLADGSQKTVPLDNDASELAEMLKAGLK
jgi:histidyl-tRNA synthetase